MNAFFYILPKNNRRNKVARHLELDLLSGTRKYRAGRDIIVVCHECVCWRAYLFFLSYFLCGFLCALNRKCFSVRNHASVYHVSCMFFVIWMLTMDIHLSPGIWLDWTWQCQMNLMRAAAVGQRAKQLWDQVLSPPWSWECSPTEPLLNWNKPMSWDQSQGRSVTKDSGFGPPQALATV